MNKLILIVLLILNIQVFSQTEYENCKEKFKSGDFKNAKIDCIKASHNGNAICQAYLGIIYLSQSKIDSARVWFEKSAVQGNAIGQNGFGYLYQNGLGGLTKNTNKANEWFLKSAKQENTDSQFWLGENLFLAGNKIEGYKWTLKASLKGSQDAQFNLGTMFRNGGGIEKDENKSIIWYIISASNGNIKAKSIIDKLISQISKEQFQIYLKMTEDFIKNNPLVMR